MTPTIAPATAQSPARRMTAGEFWDFCQLPENHNRDFELVRGEVIEVPRPTKRHGRLCSRISHLLEVYADAVGGGYPVSNDSGVILEEGPDTVVGPDVAYYRDTATTFADIHPKWGEEVPVLAIEVLSPSDRPSRVNDKVADYLANGVRLVWLVDHEDRKVTVYRPGRSHEMVAASGMLSGGVDLPGLEITVADLFKLPGEPKPTPNSPPS